MSYKKDNTNITGIILFGDSVLCGTGASRRQYGCGKLLKYSLSNMPVLIKGRNRDTTRDGLERLQTNVLDQESHSHVIVLFGNNDCRLVEQNKPSVSLEEYKSNLHKMIQHIKKNKKTVFLSNLQPISSEGFYRALPEMKKYIKNMEGSPYYWHKKYSDACSEVATIEGIRLIDIRVSLEMSDENIFAEDGLHPNDLGHRIIADKFIETLHSIKVDIRL